MLNYNKICGYIIKINNFLLIPYVSVQLRSIFVKHPKTCYASNWPTPKHQSNTVYTLKCQEDSCKLYTGDTKQPLAKWRAQHRRALSSGLDSLVHLDTRANGHAFNYKDLHILDREERRYDQGAKEDIYVKREVQCWNWGGLRENL